MELIPTPPERPQTPEQVQAEAEAMLRIANAIGVALPAITSEHWHDALSRTSERLQRCARRRGYRPSLGEVE